MNKPRTGSRRSGGSSGGSNKTPDRADQTEVLILDTPEAKPRHDPPERTELLDLNDPPERSRDRGDDDDDHTLLLPDPSSRTSASTTNNNSPSPSGGAQPSGDAPSPPPASPPPATPPPATPPPATDASGAPITRIGTLASGATTGPGTPRPPGSAWSMGQAIGPSGSGVKIAFRRQGPAPTPTKNEWAEGQKIRFMERGPNAIGTQRSKRAQPSVPAPARNAPRIGQQRPVHWDKRTHKKDDMSGWDQTRLGAQRIAPEDRVDRLAYDNERSRQRRKQEVDARLEADIKKLNDDNTRDSAALRSQLQELDNRIDAIPKNLPRAERDRQAQDLEAQKNKLLRDSGIYENKIQADIARRRADAEQEKQAIDAEARDDPAWQERIRDGTNSTPVGTGYQLDPAFKRARDEFIIRQSERDERMRQLKEEWSELQATFQREHVEDLELTQQKIENALDSYKKLPYGKERLKAENAAKDEQYALQDGFRARQAERIALLQKNEDEWYARREALYKEEWDDREWLEQQDKD